MRPLALAVDDQVNLLEITHDERFFAVASDERVTVHETATELVRKNIRYKGAKILTFDKERGVLSVINPNALPGTP